MRAEYSKGASQAVKFVSPSEAAEVLGAHPQTLRRWAKAGTLPHYVTSGGRYRYDLSTFLTSLPKSQHRAA